MAITQEFHCHGCDGYLIFRLSDGFNRRVLLVCPNCGRKHQRVVEDGVIRDKPKRANELKLEEIYIPKSSWNKNPRSHAQEEATKEGGLWHTLRDGAIIDTPRSLIEESWFDRYGDKVT